MTHRNDRYEKAGYVCSGPFCAANNPSGSLLRCAKKGPAGSVANGYTGKCEVHSHVGERLHGFGVLPSSQSLCNRDARRPAIILVPSPDYLPMQATGGAPIRLAAPKAMLFDIAVHGFPSDGIRVAEQSHLGGLEVRGNNESGIHFEPAARGSTLQADRNSDPSVPRYFEGAPELVQECAITEQQRSIIVDNQLHGIYADVDGVRLSSAFIGLEVNGITPRGNGLHGIYIPVVISGAFAYTNSAAASVGSSEYDASRLEGLRVVIANNKGNGIRSCGRVDVHNTFVGVEADGVSPSGNGQLSDIGAVGLSGIQIGCGDELHNPKTFYGTDAGSNVGTLTSDLLESISYVVVAANFGSGIKIEMPIGKVKVSNTNVGVGSDGFTLAGNLAHGVEIVNSTYTYTIDTNDNNHNRDVQLHNVVIVASRKNGIDARGKVKITCSYIGVLRNCIAKSGQFHEANEHAGNRKFGLELHDYLDAGKYGSYGKAEKSEVTGTTFVNNKFGGIFSKAMVSVQNTFIGEDACGNLHLTPQLYGITIPIEENVLAKLTLNSTKQWNGKQGGAMYAASISAEVRSTLMTHPFFNLFSFYLVGNSRTLVGCTQGW